jgi:hypothetical protein
VFLCWLVTISKRPAIIIALGLLVDNGVVIVEKRKTGKRKVSSGKSKSVRSEPTVR